MRALRKSHRLHLAAIVVAACLQTTACAAVWSTSGGAEPAVAIPSPVVDEPAAASDTHETALLAGGCFWGVQGIFEHARGVDRAVSGYAGGTAPTAHYDQVSTGETGHAESVQIIYDPAQISYGQLLRIFFSVAHDPTQLNRQGPDVGNQYRSVIFPQNAIQKKIAEDYIVQLNTAKVFDAPIVTDLENATEFYPAERHHQDFLNSNPTYPYIVTNDMPKLENFKRLFPGVYREQPVLVLASAQ